MENKKPKCNTKYDEQMSNIDPILLNKWKKEQDELKIKLIETDSVDYKSIKRIGGMDISASKSQPDVAVVCLVVCDSNNFEILYEKYEFVKMTQPYVPGFLAFREVDHLLKLIQDLKAYNADLLPDVILIDGNGIMHVNRFGLACHLGVLCDIPTIGCAKTVFSVDGINVYKVKQLAKELHKGGDFVYLKGNSGDIWGAALRGTDNSTDPIIISQGHKVGLDTAIEIVKNCCYYRVPEPIRIADKGSRYFIKQYNGEIFDI